MLDSSLIKILAKTNQYAYVICFLFAIYNKRFSDILFNFSE